MHQVSPHFLEQTLDKKLMSDLRVFIHKTSDEKHSRTIKNITLILSQRKRTAHERAKELYASGEFSSGRRWADDAPKERVDTSGVNLIDSGACGAFVHGLEDEMYGRYFKTLSLFIFEDILALSDSFGITFHRGAYCCCGGAMFPRPILTQLC